MTTLVDKEFQNWLKENRSLPWAESDIVEMAFKAGWEARGMANEIQEAVERDLKLYGIAYTVNGERVCPNYVVRYTPTERNDQ